MIKRARTELCHSISGDGYACAGALALDVIEYHSAWSHLLGMKHTFLSLLFLTLWAGAASADCYADYKAKRDGPLRLHYGVAKVAGDCTASNATAQLRDRLSADDWQLLNVVGVFEDAGLEERKESAGEYFLRY